MGYSGGKKDHPTYQNILDHTEAVLIEYDPDEISFEDILVEWAQQHSPHSQGKRQYRSAIWYRDADQQLAAEDAVRALEGMGRGRKVYTSIEPISGTRFYQAEEYHQNFIAKRTRGY